MIKIKNYQAILLLILIFGSFFSPSLSNASDSITSLSEDQKKAIQNKQDQLDAINAKIKAYKQIIDLKQRQGSTLSDQIQSLEAQANKLELEINLNKQKADDLQEGISSLSSRIAEKESLINRQKQILVELMRTYYSDYSSGAATLIFSTDETASYLNNEDWSTQTNGKISDLLDSVKTLRESLAVESAVLEEKKKAADELHIQLTERNDYLASVKDNKEYLLTKTQAEVEKYGNLVDNLQKQRDEIEQEINNVESGLLDSINLKNMPAFRHGLIAYPLKATTTVSQGYGNTSFAKISSFYGQKHFHNGLDFAAPKGTPIYAAMGGRIVGIGNEGKFAYGRWIAIDHGNGIITLYGHMSSQLVSKGETVKAGDKIGLVGATGYATGPHVHFSIFSAESFRLIQSKIVSSLLIPVGATVNPSAYLP
jgi:murein DD-endopeptidase MepM/ murein hydrolase activator NlpD